MVSAFRNTGWAGCGTLVFLLATTPAWAGGSAAGNTDPFELRLAQELPEVVVVGAGHTDSQDPDTYNLERSKGRAESFVETAVGYGWPSRPNPLRRSRGTGPDRG